MVFSFSSILSRVVFLDGLAIFFFLHPVACVPDVEAAHSRKELHSDYHHPSASGKDLYHGELALDANGDFPRSLCLAFLLPGIN
jgi:hypothetical protein